MRTLRRSLASLAALTAVLVSGCTSVDGVQNGTGPAGSSGAPGLAAALALVPAAAGSAEVMDLAAAKARWGLSGVTSESDPNSAEVRQLRSKLASGGLGSTLLTYESLFEGAGWNGWDVDTEVRPSVEGPPVTIYRLRSSLDMQTVISSLRADGMTRSGTDDAPFFRSAKIGDGAFGRVFLSGVTVYPASHLLVGGPQGSWSMPAAGGSLTDVPGVSALTADLPPADYVAIDTGAGACATPTLGGTSSAESARKYLESLEASGDRQPVTGTLVAVTADDAGEIRANYANAAAAAADLPVRTKILQTVDSPVSRQPYSQLFTATISQTGSTLRYAVDEQRPAALIRLRQQQDTPWAYC